MGKATEVNNALITARLLSVILEVNRLSVS